MNEQSKEDSTMTKQEALLRVEELRKECGVNTYSSQYKAGFQKALADCINILNDLDEPTLPVDLARECFVKGWRACASWTQQAKAPAQEPEMEDGWEAVDWKDVREGDQGLLGSVWKEVKDGYGGLGFLFRPEDRGGVWVLLDFFETLRYRRRKAPPKPVEFERFFFQDNGCWLPGDVFDNERLRKRFRCIEIIESEGGEG